MRSLFDLISKNSKDNSIIPIIALLAIVAIILFYVFVKIKWIKYVFSSIITITGLVILYRGYQSMLTPEGLDSIIFATKILVFGFVSLFTSIIFDIIDSLSEIFKGKNGKKKQKDPTFIKKEKSNLVETVELNSKDVKNNLEIESMVSEETKIINLENLEK